MKKLFVLFLFVVSLFALDFNETLKKAEAGNFEAQYSRIAT